MTSSDLPGTEASAVLSTDGVREDDLVALAAQDIRAIRIPQYYCPALAQRFADQLLGHPLFGYYENAKAIGRVAMAYYETIANPAVRERYYGLARPAMRALRQACAPCLAPIDRLRLELQEAWPWGANLENVDNRTMFVGLARVFEPGAEALPHHDHLWEDAPHSPQAHTLRTEFAANVYLRMGEGGALELWPQRCTPAEYDALRLPGSYGLDRTQLSAPDLVLHPQVGELIIFDSSRLHAVRPIESGIRLTLSCFIGYRGRHYPLSFWS